MKKRRSLAVLFVSVFVFGVLAVTTWAGDKYPTHTIEMVSAAPGPGGPVGLGEALFRKFMEKELGVPFVSVYKPGAGGTLATAYLAKAARPDGYTIANLSDFMFTSVLQGTATYKLEDLRVIAQIARSGRVLVTHPDAPFKNFQEFIDYAKKNPGIQYASMGVTMSIGLVAEYLNKVANLKMVNIPMKGDQDLITAVLGKHVPVAAIGAVNAKALSDAGRLKILFSFDPPKSIGLDPSIPDFASFFGKNVQEVQSSVYVVVPAKTPEDIVQVLARATEKVAKNPEYIEGLKRINWMASYLPGKTVMEDVWPKKIPIFKAIMQQAGVLK
jgi:tripartite-type tricarboxylate transporter receptor subunit TctC